MVSVSIHRSHELPSTVKAKHRTNSTMNEQEEPPRITESKKIYSDGPSSYLFAHSDSENFGRELYVIAQ